MLMYKDVRMRVRVGDGNIKPRVRVGDGYTTVRSLVLE